MSKFERYAAPSDDRETLLAYLDTNTEVATLLAEALHVLEHVPYVEKVSITGKSRYDEGDPEDVTVWVYLRETNDFPKLESALYYLWEQKFSELDEDVFVAVL